MMDYGALLGRAWQLTMRHRFLWILGLFAATSVGSCGTNGGSGINYRTGPDDLSRASPQAQQVMNQVTTWVVSNIGLILGGALLLLLLGLVVAILSFISQGAMARATYDLAEGRETTLGQAWRAGVSHVWRYVGLWLIVAVLGFAVAMIFVLLYGGGALLAFGVRSLQGPLAVLGAVLGIVAALIAIPVGIGVTVIVAYAQRAIVVDNLGPWDALVTGYRLLRANLGSSLIVWLITIALGIAAGVAIVLLGALLLIPLGGLGFILWNIGRGLSVALGVYALLSVITFVGLLWLLGGVMNAYFWNVWTLTYLQLTHRQPPAVPQV